ncbi:DUF2806 domain-containing protein [Stenotrophomonas sp. 364]|uniref:DUF2806 domain-containing protein n=1 Tax=Stenotrophomonas sp. 364 TaxID=2691571 RepID=UPI001317E6E3|nr:DUF2806 domain-containing protein [Stenotrophomonas sp. 364]QHB72083.1 DUF2806 domain-containing protein [Stenotrophomonas sp. 364]
MDLPGEKLILGLWESLAEKGVGNLLRPWHLKRIAKAEGQAQRDGILFLAQAEQDAARIRRGEAQFSLDGVLVATNAPALGLGMNRPDADSSNLVCQEQVDENAGAVLIQPSVASALRDEAADVIRREINVSHAILRAEDLLRDNADPDAKVAGFDEDWLFRWRELAGQVSKEQVQELWGRVLAGEAVSPGTYSLRTLEFLRSISAADAALIEKVAPFMLDRAHCANHKMGADLVQFRWVSYPDLLELEALGLVVGAELTGHEVSVGSVAKDTFVAMMRLGGKVIVVKHNDAARRFTLSGFSMTSLGRQVMSLCADAENDEYTEWLCVLIQEFGYNVELGQVTGIESGMVQYTTIKSFPASGNA